MSAESFLQKLGWQIDYAGDGKIFQNWNGKRVAEKKYKYIVNKNNVRYIGRTLESLVVNFIKLNLISYDEIVSNGHIVCGRCGGKGIHNSYRYVEGGICYKCNGEGIIYK